MFHHGNCKSPWLLGNCLVVDCKKCSICHYMLPSNQVADPWMWDIVLKVEIEKKQIMFCFIMGWITFLCRISVFKIEGTYNWYWEIRKTGEISRENVGMYKLNNGGKGSFKSYLIPLCCVWVRFMAFLCNEIYVQIISNGNSSKIKFSPFYI